MQKSGLTVTRNPNKCEHRDAFHEFARLVADSDEDFLNELIKTEGHKLRFFGPYEFRGRTLFGADTQNNAYKKTVRFLEEKRFI